ncbi:MULTISPECIES: PHB depolymerase family esterase [unclassified Fibrobacter]|uniref:PHB depolymerase family esterase n=1 Tax=unclassified Fibrobacter TaxID=2634177 RepID=UPI0025C3F25B|nr:MULTISPECIES: PHB depolymerase family esterase [unclassified Fibrobacter]
MHFPKLLGVASAIAMSSSLAFAWSIDGVVKSKVSGRLLAGVKISTFNFGGFETTSAEDGTFSLSGGSDALAGAKAADMSIHMEGTTLTLYNVYANKLKVSVISALGKVLKESNLQTVQGIVTLDMGKLARGTKFIRISADSQNSTFMVTDKGVKALKKEGDLLPMLQFALDGYANFVYQMQAETETGVTIEMVRPSSSSSSEVAPPQSSSVVASSSSKVTPSSSNAGSDEPIVVDCSGKTAKVGDKQNMSVTVDGKQRTFIMHIPSAYKGDKPVPLVIDYHPIGGSGNGEFGSSPYKAKTDPEGVITLYPDGTSKPGGMGNGWNVGPCCSNDDDVKFSYAMIDKLKEIACIDPQRIYATGFSMGGGMSNHVACMMSDVFAAVAPAAMDLNKTNSAACKMSRPISVINFRGTNDPVCKYQGGDSGFNDGLNFLGAEGTFKFWGEKNGCTGAPTKNSNGCDEYSNCQDGVKVVLCTKQGGGHDYGDASIGWPFLKQFTLPASFVK